MTIAAGWVYWFAIQLLAIVLTVVGWPLIFVMAKLALWKKRPSLYYPDSTVLVWRGGWLTWIWGNEEDGIDGLRGGSPEQAWWWNETGGFKPWERVWLWCAWRNSVNNLRFLVEWLGGPSRQFEIGRAVFRIGWNPNGYPVLERLS